MSDEAQMVIGLHERAMKQQLRKGDEVPFTQVANAVLNDKRLSWKAKGLFAYLYSKPNDWDFNGDRVTADGSDGRKAVFSGLKELEQGKYLKRSKQPDGRMVYEITFDPDAQKGQQATDPIDRNGKVPKRQSAKRGSISNKEPVQTKELVQTENICDVNTLIDGFREVNPSFARLFSNRTQRAAIERMVKAHGCEKTQSTIAFLKISNGRPYAPVITTPLELERNLGRLVAWSQREKQSAVGIVL